MWEREKHKAKEGDIDMYEDFDDNYTEIHNNKSVHHEKENVQEKRPKRHVQKAIRYKDYII